MDIKYDLELELRAMKNKISELEAENAKLKEVIVDNELQDDIEGIDVVSVEEKICVDGIKYIATLVDQQDFDKKDIDSFQTLFNILRTIRGKSTAGNKKVKNADVKDLLKIVGGQK